MQSILVLGKVRISFFAAIIYRMIYPELLSFAYVVFMLSILLIISSTKGIVADIKALGALTLSVK